MDQEWLAWALDGPLSIAPLSWSAILACVLSGGIIGFERQSHGKPIGVRTNIVICLGTYTLVTAGLAVATDMSDPTRIVGQIITGIGFLGAGVMMTRDGAIVGVTTAASIWMLAAIGVVIATISPYLGVKLSVLAVIVLAGVNYLESGLERLRTKTSDASSGDPSPDGTPEVEPLDQVDAAGSKQSELKKREQE